MNIFEDRGRLVKKMDINRLPRNKSILMFENSLKKSVLVNFGKGGEEFYVSKPIYVSKYK